jgi:hypothetical protein
MEKHQTFPEGCIVIATAFLSMFLAIVAMIASVNHYQYPSHPSCADGARLGAGFPVLFICDDWGGGSPTNSWGKIDFVDVLNGGIKPLGFTIDFLFYTLMFWLPFLLCIAIYRLIDRRMDRPPPGN